MANGGSLKALLFAAIFWPAAVSQAATDDPGGLRLRTIHELPADATSEGHGFELVLSVPLLWTSSVLAADSDTGSSSSPDWHSFPEAALRWSHQFSGMRISALGALSGDRYFEETNADINQVDAELLAEWTDGSSGAFVPYLRYAHVSYFDRDFVSLDDHRHDLWAGVSGTGLLTSDGWRLGRSARQPGESSLGYDLYGGRRFANEEGIRHVVTGITLDYKYVVSNDLSFHFYPGVRLRWYDDISGLPDRNDFRLSARAKVKWSPDWLEAALPNSTLEFSVEYFHNSSTDPEARYDLWEIGPTLTLSKRF